MEPARSQWTERCVKFAKGICRRFPNAELEEIQPGRFLSREDFAELESLMKKKLPKCIRDYYQNDKCGFKIDLVFDVEHDEVPPPEEWPEGLECYMGFEIIDPLSFGEFGYVAQLHRAWGMDLRDPTFDSSLKGIFYFATSGRSNFVCFEYQTESDDPPMYYYDALSGSDGKGLHIIADPFTKFMSEWEGSGYPQLGGGIGKEYLNSAGRLDHTLESVKKIKSFLSTDWND